MRSTTSSFRISDELRVQLEAAADRLKRGKNAIITEALREYLHRINQERFLEEARRQSFLASAVPRTRADGNSPMRLTRRTRASMMAIKRERISRVIGRVDTARMQEVGQALRRWLEVG